VSNPNSGVTALGQGRFLVQIGGRRVTAWGIADGPRIWVFVDGVTRTIDPPAARTVRGGVRGGEVDEAALAAPMPATVVQIRVTPGQLVHRGDPLVMLEAMKMELAIAAPRDGVVRAIACRVGDLVAPGVPLVEIEAAG